MSGDSAAGGPRVTATGEGALAERILDIAFANGVKVREDAALVDILSTLEVDSPIPLEALTAVSMVLERVYRANQEASGDHGATTVSVGTGARPDAVEGVYRHAPAQPRLEGNGDG
ncbi:EscU/YscU/HrcU family type III secretion system export apparatus switch protein [Yunchengibacter salinarum]|uniref:EscU/YscU/HrcU family type III secretion system export apparatus switch protein n=1 Tax=Yunchengibacter salinarum TaxID=3133399 RepID=UPI0035B6A32D